MNTGGCECYAFAKNVSDGTITYAHGYGAWTLGGTTGIAGDVMHYCPFCGNRLDTGDKVEFL